ncbi:MAG: hypothetical protein BAA01_03275 [Bacillus thermozeamaize]|uniref:Uncharacterized protein n=1 Tax=Bacillus thermozeamaize TaxID=230954 RepID=A0A1Y3PMN5_9BACI|nr:MAG: hypothetical protein BAA01_03275 [Bacillus thermozeamaize]
MRIDTGFALFLAAAAYDFVCLRFYTGLLPVAGGLVLTWGSPAFGAVLLATGLSVLLADLTRRAGEKERRLQRILDNERRLRYELSR